MLTRSLSEFMHATDTKQQYQLLEIFMRCEVDREQEAAELQAAQQLAAAASEFRLG